MEQHQEHQKQCIERFGSVSCLSKIGFVLEAVLFFGLAGHKLWADCHVEMWATDIISIYHDGSIQSEPSNLPDEPLQNVSTLAEVKAALKQCSRCRYLKNGERWAKRCVYTDNHGVVRSWLAEAPRDPTDPDFFGLTCVLCMSYARAFPEASKSHVLKSKNVGIEDLLRHGGLSRSKQQSKYHQKALEYHLAISKPESEEQSLSATADPPVTAYQVLLSWQTVFSPTAAQRSTFEAKCAQAALDAPHLCPRARSSGSTHMKIQQAGATVLFEQNREWLLSPGLRSIGLAEVCRQQ